MGRLARRDRNQYSRLNRALWDPLCESVAHVVRRARHHSRQ
ncbi:Uncharacterised protein [Vibrio cholerae]|nr:Uncharacterised protein [Vibrio cholerae]